MKIDQSKILLIGGVGFIGSHVVAALLKTKVVLGTGPGAEIVDVSTYTG